jgi:membrane protein implicated in regulation of membrane protease activity
MAPTVFLTARDVLGGAAGSHDFPVLAIAGFATAGGILLLVGLWLLIRVVRKRAQRRREDKRGAAFLSVKGLVNEKGYTLEDVFAA